MKINKDELIEWFWEKFNSCYLVKHDDYPESVFMYYDHQYIRKLKLANISGEKISSKTDVTGICLFEQDWKNKNFYCDSNQIWDHLYSNYSTKYDEIQQFISDRLEELTKISVLTPCELIALHKLKLEELTKISVLTPRFGNFQNAWWLEELTKISVLTPNMSSVQPCRELEELTKMSKSLDDHKLAKWFWEKFNSCYLVKHTFNL